MNMNVNDEHELPFALNYDFSQENSITVFSLATLPGFAGFKRKKSLLFAGGGSPLRRTRNPLSFAHKKRYEKNALSGCCHIHRQQSLRSEH
jgi:hypothetical protein